MTLTVGNRKSLPEVENRYSEFVVKITDLKITDKNYFHTSLYEMSNYGSNSTGLFPGTSLWVRTEPQQHGHVKYRIKLNHPQKGDAIFAIWGDEVRQVEGDWKVTGRELRRINALINQTQKAIRQHIDGLIDSGELAIVFKQAKDSVEQI